jgi:hypothetical protein
MASQQQRRRDPHRGTPGGAGPRNPRISRQLAIRALSRRNWTRAEEHFDRVLEVHPRFARIHQLSRFAACMADPSRAAAQACSLAREAGS